MSGQRTVVLIQLQHFARACGPALLQASRHVLWKRSLFLFVTGMLVKTWVKTGHLFERGPLESFMPKISR
ncbi:hypothetical protein C7Y45_15665 [Brevibacillus brevis]|nr:hypothetical protein C7Y45_15665 [Lysinibacillus sp. SDF0063]